VTGASDPADWFERVPKVELHVHLEGAIPLDALWTLVRKYGGDPAWEGR
jgi:adenosine deaminase